MTFAATIGAPASAALLPKIVSEYDLIHANSLRSIVGTVAGFGVGGLLWTLMSNGAGF